jgi:hypothetical protein
MPDEIKLTPEQEAINNRMGKCIKRFENYSGWYLMQGEIPESGMGLDTLVREMYIQTAMNHASQIALTNLICSKREFTVWDVMAVTVTLLEQRLADTEQELEIKITQKQCGRNINMDLEKEPEENTTVQ